MMSDEADKLLNKYSQKFQPTLPVRGTAEDNKAKYQKLRISTHVPRTGNDALHGRE
jgi:hypothetical protein